MQNIRKNFLSVKDAAQLAGVNRMTIWRAVVKGEIEQLAQPEQEEQPGKKRAIWVQKDSLEAWIAQRPVTPVDSATEQVTPVIAQLEHVTSHLAQVEHEQLSILSELAFQTINKALERASQAEQRLERAVARAEATERQSQALHFELRSYQRVLTEQVDSLAEERAHRLTLEQQQLKLDTPKSGRLSWPDRWRRLLGLKSSTG